MMWLQRVKTREVRGSKNKTKQTNKKDRTKQNIPYGFVWVMKERQGKEHNCTTEHDVSVLREMFPFPQIEPKDSI